MEGRLLPLVAALVALLGCALAAHSSVMHTSSASPPVLPSSSHHPYTSMSHSLSSGVSPHPPPTPSPSRSPSPPPPTSTVVVPTPSPSPVPPNRSYMLRRNGTVCVHLKASIETAVTYTTENGTRMKVFSVTSNANVSVNDEASLCDDKSAVLVLSWEDHYNLSFIFNTSGVTWTEGNVTFQYAIDEEIFPGYHGNSVATCSINVGRSGKIVTCSDISGCQVECPEDWLHTGCLEDYCLQTLYSSGVASESEKYYHQVCLIYQPFSSSMVHGQGEAVFGNLLDNQTSNIEQQRSFLCNESRTLYSNDIGTNQTTSTTLTVWDFQVQAFYFRNSTSGEFDNARNCNGGPTNAIVPIVVGAALAGLVVLVLVAYLIGRIKNRRQSSYQALS